MEQQILSLIDSIIEDLISQESNLENDLLKTQVLAFKLKNEELKVWINKELNGYGGDDIIPSYRIISNQIKGDLYHGLPFGGYQQIPNSVLPFERLGKDWSEILKVYKFKIRISELQELSKSKNGLYVELPYSFLVDMSKKMSPWEVVKARKEISSSSVTGILSTIKSNLINFLLELKEELGDENIPLMEKKKKIDQIVERNIGTIKAENVNISFGNDVAQSINAGANAIVNNAKGDVIEQTTNVNLLEELSNFMSELKPLVTSLSLQSDDRQDIVNEITRIDTQLARQNPKHQIINEALKLINGILIGVAGNALTPQVIEKLSWLISQFS